MSLLRLPADSLVELYCSSGVIMTSNSRGIGLHHQLWFFQQYPHPSIHSILLRLVNPFRLDKQERVVE